MTKNLLIPFNLKSEEKDILYRVISSKYNIPYDFFETMIFFEEENLKSEETNILLFIFSILSGMNIKFPSVFDLNNIIQGIKVYEDVQREMKKKKDKFNLNEHLMGLEKKYNKKFNVLYLNYKIVENVLEKNHGE